MVREREPPKISSPRKASNAMDHPPDFLINSTSQPNSKPTSQVPNYREAGIPVTKVPHDQTLVAQKIRDGADPYSQRPQFDHSSSTLGVNANSHVFNKPKPNKPRAEHHRNPSQTNTNNFSTNPSLANSSQRIPSYGSDSAADLIGKPSSGFRLPSFMSQFGPEYANAAPAGPAPVPISHPMNTVPAAIPAAPRPMFSTDAVAPISTGQWRQPIQVQSYVRPGLGSTYVDLTKEANKVTDGGFDVSKATGGANGFGVYDPMDYVDSAQANENIKALLEGAFEEDEDDKPKTRRIRKKDRSRADEEEDELAGEKLPANAKEESKSKTESVESANKGASIGQTQEDEEEEDDGEEDDDDDDGTVEGLKVKLLPHQIEGVAWMMDKEVGKPKKNGVSPKGGILADDMGLGKTIQALALILSNPRPSDEWIKKNPKKEIPKAAGKGTLVVAPLALIKQWESEIKDKVLPSRKLKVLVHHGASRTKSFEDLKKYDMVITTYQTLTSEHEASSEDDKGLKVGCFGLHWYRVILDEAHSIKNRNAKMTKAAYNLKSVYRWCLTGTPMQNNLDELQSLIRFLQIKPYHDLKVWKDQITTPMKNGRGGLAVQRVQYFLKALMKRRKKDILKKEGSLKTGKDGEGKGKGGSNGFKIVAREVKTVEIDFSESEREYYNRLAERTEKSLEAMLGQKKNDYIGALVLLLRLRQICNHPDLIRGSVAKETAAFSVNTSNVQPGRRGNLMDDDMNSITNMFGDLTVKTKKCDICQAVIPKDEAAEGAIRCSECEADLAEQSQLYEKGAQKLRKGGKKHRRRPKGETKKSSDARRRQGRLVIESDDEDEDEDGREGDWVVPRSERHKQDLGKAGGQEDEDAEGGGEWLVSEDDETEEDSEDDTESSAESNGGWEEKESRSNGRATSMPSAKILKLLKILRRETKSNKVIVFSEFTSMLDLTEPFLQDTGFRFVRYDGSMRNDDREASLESLRNDDRTRVLLCSLRCGSLGLNLTAASRVVILEPFWNPFVEEQAIDRVHRLNQTKDVTVYRFTIRDSVEERILALQEKKRELAEAAIEGGKASNNLSMKDIMQLFHGDAEHSGDHHGDSKFNTMRSDGRLQGGVLDKPSSQSSQSTYSASGSFWNDARPPTPRQPSGYVKPQKMNTFGEAYGRR